MILLLYKQKPGTQVRVAHLAIARRVEHASAHGRAGSGTRAGTRDLSALYEALVPRRARGPTPPAGSRRNAPALASQIAATIMPTLVLRG